MSRILVTGGAGFIGHHFVEHVLRNSDHELVLLDRLDTSGNINRLVEVSNWDVHKRRVKFHYHDLRAELNEQLIQQIGNVDIIVHMAAATHVDRSITDPMDFVYNNVVATANILEYARKLPKLLKMIYFSTDEVFGPAPAGVEYKEWDRYNSGNPYSATKAGGEELCLAYHNTYGTPVMVTHTMNVIGERQHPEKYVPKTINNIGKSRLVTIHADKTCTIPGSRFYIHARNVADAVMFLLDKGAAGDKYNIVGEKEIDNLALARAIAAVQNKILNYELVDFHGSRPGHDLRYALNGDKMREMGWAPPVDFDTSLERVVKWTLDNPHWLLG